VIKYTTGKLVSSRKADRIKSLIAMGFLPFEATQFGKLRVGDASVAYMARRRRVLLQSHNKSAKDKDWTKEESSRAWKSRIEALYKRRGAVERANPKRLSPWEMRRLVGKSVVSIAPGDMRVSPTHKGTKAQIREQKRKDKARRSSMQTAKLAVQAAGNLTDWDRQRIDALRKSSQGATPAQRAQYTKQINNIYRSRA
jgi:hypothetical protein